MSLNMYRDLQRSIKNGVNFSNEQCRADMMVGGGSGMPVSQYLHKYSVKNMSNFCKTLGHGQDYVKRLYRDHDLETINQLINEYRKINGMSEVEF